MCTCDVKKNGITSFLGALHDACVWVGNNQGDSNVKTVVDASKEAYQKFITYYGSTAHNLSQIIANMCIALGPEVSAQCPAVVPCIAKKEEKCLNSI